MYNRLLQNVIKENFFKGKAIILTGARQTGKTTLSLNILKTVFPDKKYKIFNCDNPTDRDLLSDRNIEFLQKLAGDTNILFIDEGQKVKNIGQTLKLLVDYYGSEKQILITGSSSINLLDFTYEALTGRKYVYHLYPLSLEELYPEKDIARISKTLDTLLIFGAYPDIINKQSFDQKIELLQELSSSYLYKDIFEFQQIKNASVIMNILKALALQIGSEVSYNEMSNFLGIDKKTIERYIDLLEKNFVIFRLSPYMKNKRREISKLKKIYFYDLGIRNAIIQNFNFLENRDDIGALWENFIIVERLKYRAYHKIYANQYFWRTYDGSEVDLVEEREGKLYGFECKWKYRERKKKEPAKWLEYPHSSYKEITVNTMDGFVI